MRGASDCGPIGFGPQFIVEMWLRKCIGRFAKRGYSENRRLIRSKREYAYSFAVNGKWRVLKTRGIILCTTCIICIHKNVLELFLDTHQIVRNNLRIISKAKIIECKSYDK